MKEKVYMSIQEAERLSIMRQIDKKVLTIKKGSEELGLSLRQMKRVRKRYVQQGEIRAPFPQARKREQSKNSAGISSEGN